MSKQIENTDKTITPTPKKSQIIGMKKMLGNEKTYINRIQNLEKRYILKTSKHKHPHKESYSGHNSTHMGSMVQLRLVRVLDCRINHYPPSHAEL